MNGEAQPSDMAPDTSSSLSDMDVTVPPDMPALVTNTSFEDTPVYPCRHSTSPPAPAADGNTAELLASNLTEADTDAAALMRTETSTPNSACTTLDVNASTAPPTAPSRPGLQAASSLRMHDVSSERHKGGGAGLFMPPSVGHPPSFCLHSVLDGAAADGAGGDAESLWPQSAFEIVGASIGSTRSGARDVEQQHPSLASHVAATSEAAADNMDVAAGEAAASKELPLRASSAVLEHDIAIDVAVAVEEVSAILPELPPGTVFGVQGAGQPQAVAHEVFPMTEADKANVLGGQVCIPMTVLGTVLHVQPCATTLSCLICPSGSYSSTSMARASMEGHAMLQQALATCTTGRDSRIPPRLFACHPGHVL
jgi:hypothetical protein